MKNKGVQWFEYDPIDLTSPEYKLGKALGEKKGVRHIPNLNNSSRVLSLDSDFMGSREPNSLSNTKAFMKGRKVLSKNDARKMNRLYSVESDLTITGGVADHRLRLESSQITAFTNLLTAEILKIRKSKDVDLINRLTSRGNSMTEHTEWIIQCAKDLCKSLKIQLFYQAVT